MSEFCFQYDLRVHNGNINGFCHQRVYYESIDVTPISYSEAVKNTSNHAGGAKGSLALSSMPKSKHSQMQLKHGLELEPFTDSTIMSNASILSNSGLKEHLAPRVFEKNQKHKLLLETMRWGDEWQRDLEHVHGLTEAESCECFSRAGKYLSCDSFPEDAVNRKLFSHAKEGWIILKEVDSLCKEYPKELMELDSLAAIEGKLFGEF